MVITYRFHFSSSRRLEVSKLAVDSSDSETEKARKGGADVRKFYSVILEIGRVNGTTAWRQRIGVGLDHFARTTDL